MSRRGPALGAAQHDQLDGGFPLVNFQKIS